MKIKNKKLEKQSLSNFDIYLHWSLHNFSFYSAEKNLPSLQKMSFYCSENFLLQKYYLSLQKFPCRNFSLKPAENFFLWCWLFPLKSAKTFFKVFWTFSLNFAENVLQVGRKFPCKKFPRSLQWMSFSDAENILWSLQKVLLWIYIFKSAENFFAKFVSVDFNFF